MDVTADHRADGLIALAVGEAALSLMPGATLSSMALRYLRAVRRGPAVATAEVRAGLGRVDVRDEGDDDRPAVTATTRAFAPTASATSARPGAERAVQRSGHLPREVRHD